MEVVRTAWSELFSRFERTPPPLRVETFRYRSFKVQLQKLGGTYFVKLHPAYLGAPSEALLGILCDLYCRVHNYKRPSWANLPLREFKLFQQELEVPDSQKKVPLMQGSHHSITESFLRVMWTSGIEIDDPPKVGWSHRDQKTRLGWYDRQSHTIFINSILDSPKVPAMVVDDVLHHELLHIVHPPKIGPTGRRNVHHIAFRRAESRYPDHAAAEKWIATHYANMTRHT